MKTFDPSLNAEIARNVAAALAEDIGPGDLTAELVPAGRPARATVLSRQTGILCGTAWFDACILKLEPAAQIRWSAQDGEAIAPGQRLCEITGAARPLLSAERSALNFLQLLSGIATRAHRYVAALAGTRAQVVDTRKTLPGLRIAQKYAVRCGGAGNHRLALWDAILIKENHILAAGSLTAALAGAHQASERADGRCRFIQVEVETLEQLETALAAGATMILLDNFGLDAMREAVCINAGRAILEASGNVTLETLRAIAETGVDRISAGSLTKDVEALDLSMRFME